MKARVYLHLGTIAVLFALLGAVGCTKAPNDAQISSDIQNKLNTDSGLANKQLKIESANGTVTLSGNVDNQTERDAAARYAASVPGVKQVVNNLQVASDSTAAAEMAQPPVEPAPTPQPAPAESSAKPAPSRRHHRAASSSSDNNLELKYVGGAAFEFFFGFGVGIVHGVFIGCRDFDSCGASASTTSPEGNHSFGHGDGGAFD